MLKSLNTTLAKASIGFSSVVATALASAPTVFGQSVDDVFEGSVETGDFFYTSFPRLISAILRIVIVIAALLVFFYLIWGAIEWITSGGDKGQTEKARNKITASIIGLVILSATVALFFLVMSFFGIGSFDELFTLARTANDDFGN